ncbi:MAG TPA: hypothetical protein VKB69_14015 [Micromonosporaceae bacterium]|nr:hypothetical protein [Micromonosporaceae bacterium]
MATTECTPERSVPLAEVEGSRSATSWSVAEIGWKQLLPDLPDDVIALLATPVVVTAESLAPSPAPADPGDGPGPAKVAPQAVIDACTPRFLAPAPPERTRANRRPG